MQASQRLTPHQMIKRILNKPHEDRSEEEIGRLMGLLKDINFFKQRDIKEPDLPEICSGLKLEEFSAGDMVFQYGKVAVLLPRQDETPASRKDVKEKKSKSQNTILRKSLIDSGVNIKRDQSETVTATRDQVPEGAIKNILQNLNNSGRNSRNSGESGANLVVPGIPPPRKESQFKTADRMSVEAGFIEQVKKMDPMQIENQEAHIPEVQGESPKTDRTSSSQERHLQPTPDETRPVIKKSTISTFDSVSTVSQISAHFLKKNHPDFSEVAELKTGQAFGELALLKNKPRAAGILCKTHCAFAVMVRYDYKKILGKIEQKRLNQLTDFLYSLPYFANWTRGSIQKFQYFFTKREYQRNQMIFREGDKPLNVYLILEGEFQISINHTFRSAKSIDCQSLLGHKGREKESKIFNKNVVINQNLFNGGGENPFSDVKKKQKTIKLLLLGKGNLFGQDDALSKRGLRKYSVRCCSNQGTLLEIKIGDFTKKIKTAEKTLNIIHQNLLAKQENIQRILGRIIYYERPSVLAELSGVSTEMVLSNEERLQMERSKMSMEEGFVKAMRKQIKKDRLREAKERRTKMAQNSNSFDITQKPSLIQEIINSAKRELSTASGAREDTRSQFSSSFSNYYDWSKSEASPSARGLPQMTEESADMYSPKKLKPMSVYNLKINVNPLGNRLSGGQKIYLSQAYTIKPERRTLSTQRAGRSFL